MKKKTREFGLNQRLLSGVKNRQGKLYPDTKESIWDHVSTVKRAV